MRCHPKMLLFAMLLLAAAFFPNAGIAGTLADVSQDKAADEEKETEYGEEEYNAYDAASKEPDFSKRGAMLLAFMEKYPKSSLMPYIKPAYENMLTECSQAKKYDLLEPLAEKWLKLNPGSIRTLAYIAEAAEKLGHDQKCVECLEEIYRLEPSGAMAYNILQTYKKIKNQAKVSEWADKLFKMPEFDADFGLRYGFVMQYMEAKNSVKAAEYARLTLKATDLVKEPSKEVQEQMRKVRYASHLVIGTSLYDGGKFAEAIKSLQQALRFEKHGEPYYYIGMCQWKQDLIEDATLSFARAELQGGDIAPQAKEKVEQLYKALHNNTTIGIEKIYRRAKEDPAQ
jgi:tetratricopeptide (TPR) repeat protein